MGALGLDESLVQSLHVEQIASIPRVRSGVVRIPEEFALDALRQQIGMRARDHLAGHHQEAVAGHIADAVTWKAVKAGFQQLAEAFAELCATERADLDAAWTEHDGTARERVAELDAFGVEKVYTTALSRKLGVGIARHAVTPWGALIELKGHVDPVHWTPPPYPP